jgi:uncharacterized protein (TIGR02246 family)
MNTSATDTVAGIVAVLQAGWNAADGNKFAEPFADDADFVAIRGDYHKGKAVIAKGHEGILGSIYRGSTVRYEVSSARYLADNVILAHVTSTLEAPTGPLQGIQNSVASLIVVRTGTEWKITSFHNTLVLR